jgi:GNAT superfamily N-acetyltransferase
MLSASCVGRKAEPVIDTAVVSSQLELRLAIGVDLGTLNAVIERAVMTWKLPERVKRLAMPGYRYAVHDLKYLHIVVAEDRVIGIVGVAAWESAAVHECPQGCRGLQLHGIYVDPDRQQRGVGARLLSAAGTAARGEGYDGLLVKAQADAEGFFGKQGLQKLPLVHPDRDYPRRYWLDLAQRQVASGRSDACAARPRDESRADDPS